MKSRIVAGRGTMIAEREIDPLNWAGKTFREYQEKKMNHVEPEAKLLIRKGTGSLVASEYPKPRPSEPTEGRIVSISRGTSSRRL